MLNSFALDLVTYVIFYVMLGIGVCLFVTVVWGFFRLTAKSSTPPKLHFVMWWRSFEYYPVLGVMLASLPIVAACLWIGIVIRQLDIFGQVPGTLSAQAVATNADRSRWRSGRIGASVIVMGIYAPPGNAPSCSTTGHARIFVEARVLAAQALYVHGNMAVHAAFGCHPTVVHAHIRSKRSGVHACTESVLDCDGKRLQSNAE